MEEILERQLLIRVQAFAIFSAVVKALAGCRKQPMGRMLCRPSASICHNHM